LSATPSAQYRLTIRVKLDDSQGMLLGRLTSAIGEAGGMVGAVDLVEVDESHSLRDIVVDASDPSTEKVPDETRALKRTVIPKSYNLGKTFP